MINNIVLNSVDNIPGVNAAAIFTPDSSSVFREDNDIAPISIDDKTSYIPWGADNQLPYKIIDLIEADETLSTCQSFNAEILFGAGLKYNADNSDIPVKEEISDFLNNNDIPSYFLGVCQDLKYFAFAVSVIILNEDASKIVRIYRKEACYTRFAPADRAGNIPYILFANWRRLATPDNVEKITLLSATSPFADLKSKISKGTHERKFAIVSRVPTPDSTYYPIPSYASLFRGRWYNIKQLIGLAKEAKLKNSAPIKYQIEISNKYWDTIFKQEGITDRVLQHKRLLEEKQNILDFLTGAENSGKVWFSAFYVNPNGQQQSDVIIHKIDSDKEGGDWQSDIQEAVNMFCFTMRVHSNLVGSVPGKAQSNNSGSDKRELYTIAQALQKPYHDILFTPHRTIMKFNAWTGATPEVPFIQLTTLDNHTDASTVTIN